MRVLEKFTDDQLEEELERRANKKAEMLRKTSLIDEECLLEIFDDYVSFIMGGDERRARIKLRDFLCSYINRYYRNARDIVQRVKI
jgi:hypothetical protein